MRNGSSAAFMLVLACASLTAAAQTAIITPPMVTLRITSALPGQESSFEGTLAYAGSPASEFRHIKGTTPFEVKVPDTYRIGAILKADREDGRLGIQIIGPDTKLRAAWNSGRIVIMNVDKNKQVQAEFAGL